MTGLGRVTIVVALAVVFVLGASAADLKGSLIGVACSAKIIKEGESAAKAHTRECMLKEPCVKSGYGLYTQDGKFIVFDSVATRRRKKPWKLPRRKTTLWRR